MCDGDCIEPVTDHYYVDPDNGYKFCCPEDQILPAWLVDELDKECCTLDEVIKRGSKPVCCCETEDEICCPNLETHC